MNNSRKVNFGIPKLEVLNQNDGSIIIKNIITPDEWPSNIILKLMHWSTKTPETIFLAQRNHSNLWEKISYIETLKKVKSIANFLLNHRLSEKRPLLILSGNDINHALVALACLYSKIPYSSISPAYSLFEDDLDRLGKIKEILSPGFVFADDGKIFQKAIRKLVPENKALVAKNPLNENYLIDKIVNQSVDINLKEVDTKPNDIAKFLFTSGSTGSPKAVIQTHQMLCSNISMATKAYEFIKEEPPVLVDWMPWSHVAGGNKAFNLALYNGGTFYIDNGSPNPNNFAKTVKNLSDIGPTWYFNVPKGYELLVTEMSKNTLLAKSFFKRIKLLVYSGASMPNHIFEQMEKLSVQYSGEKIFFSAAYGASETAPMTTMPTYRCNFPGNIGVPQFGTEMKLIPFGDKFEVRLKGPHITPGYWKDEIQTLKSFDNDGFFKIGDALKFHDKSNPDLGFYFDGRLSENFKLNTGTWVSVGAVRSKILNAFGGIANDVIIVGEDQEFLSAIIIPNIINCAQIAKLDYSINKQDILSNIKLKNKIIKILKDYKNKTESKSQYIKRVIFFSHKLSRSKGEITDKGSINQMAFILNRNSLVKKLYANKLKNVINI